MPGVARSAPPGIESGRKAVLVLALLALAVAAAAILALGSGAVPLGAERVLRILWLGRSGIAGDPGLARDAAIVLDIRLPRILVAIVIGASLAFSGALLQGLFRNPLADPMLVGVSPGAALAAAAVIVFGHRLAVPGSASLPFPVLPAASFAGALLTTTLLYAIATRRGKTSIGTMLLAGVALSALAGAGTGFLSFASNDRQLRDISFWMLGSLGGATWTKVWVIAPMLGVVLACGPFLARALNAFVLGEAEAFHLGFAVQRTKRLAIVAVAVAVGAAVSTAGLVGFVGLVVPHVIRMAVGPDHRLLLPASALLGAVLLLLADIVARTAVAPAELPIGIVTALIGAPYFLWLLLRQGGALEG